MSKIDTLIDWSLQAHKDKLYNFLKTLDSKSYWINIKPYRRNRGTNANAYYWVGIIKPICEFEGYNPDDKEARDKIHEKLKLQFNSEEIVTKRLVLKVPSQSPLVEYNQAIDYLEKKEWTNLSIQDGCILFPLYVFRDTPKEEIDEHGGLEVSIEESQSIPKTTTKLDSVEHYQYIERIRDHYAIEHNFFLAPPSSHEDRAVSEFDEMYEKLID